MYIYGKNCTIIKPLNPYGENNDYSRPNVLHIKKKSIYISKCATQKLAKQKTK